MQRGQLSWILSFTQSHNFTASLDAPVSPAVLACDAERRGWRRDESRVPVRLWVWESVCIVPPLVSSQYFLSENKDCVQAGHIDTRDGGVFISERVYTCLDLPSGVSR